MGIILYRPTYDASPPTWRIQLTLAEKGLEWEEIKVTYENKAADFLEKNPRGQVPTLVHDGVAVYETNAILEYLDYAFPNPPLLPTDLGERGKALVRINEASNYVMAAFMAFYRHRMNKGDEAERLKLVGGIRDELAKWEGFLEKSGGQYLVGNAFSLADISLYPYVAGAIRGQMDMQGLPRLSDFYERVSQRESAKRTFPAGWSESPGEALFR